MGGPFMQGHTIIVGPMDNGHITVDGVVVMEQFPSTHSIPGIGELTFNGMGKLVDEAQSNLQKHIVHLDLPLGVHLQVMRWANHINVRIDMTPRIGGQDGLCGNFNGNPSDDTTAQIANRIGQLQIPYDELLFHTATPRGARKAPPTLADCKRDEAKFRRAEGLCAKSVSANNVLRETCLFDVCFGGPQYAVEDGMSTSQV